MSINYELEKIIAEFDNIYKIHIKNDNYKIKDELIKGMGDNMNIDDIYNYIANTSAAYISRDPNFNKIAVEYELKKIYLILINGYIDLYEKQHKYNLISNNFYNFIITNFDIIINIIVINRDNLIDYFGIKTLERSYLLKDKNNNLLETPQMMFLRCAVQIHFNNNIIDNDIINLITETYNYMSSLYFTHATPTLFNSGANYPQLSSCYLLQCPDDLAAISKSISDMMMISKWAGGIGVNLSDIRSNGSLIKSNGGKSTGLIPLCKVLESVARYINQSNKRPGSIAVYIETWHDDIFDFIDLRKNTGDENLRARDLYLGLWVPNAFMKAVENDSDWYLMNPDESIGLTDVHSNEFDILYNKYIEEGKYVRKIKATELYHKILEAQLETGMPYMLYKDHANNKSNQQNLGTIKNSNLCSEIIEYSSPNEIAVCNLASICLPKFVDFDETEGKFKFNYEKLGEVTKIIVTNLNKIIDINFYPVPETKNSNFKHRPIGLGVQGLADTYAKIGYPFDSVEASILNKQIFECIYFHALSKSNELAILYGYYDSFIGSPFSQGKLQFHLAGYNNNDMSKELNYNWNDLVDSIKKYGTRNSLLTTIMPTASTAQIMNNNESIEPFASNIYVRKTLAGDFINVNKYLIDDLKKINKWNEQIYQELVYDNGSVQKLDIPIHLKEKYKTAYELKQSVILKQSVDRSLFIDQSQSLNIFMAKPDFNKLHSCHMYSWKNGLKTGMYYLRSQPVSDGIKFGIDSEIIKNINNKRNNITKNISCNDDVCEVCSA